jgi:hypothetical protein
MSPLKWLFRAHPKNKVFGFALSAISKRYGKQRLGRPLIAESSIQKTVASRWALFNIIPLFQPCGFYKPR